MVNRVSIAVFDDHPIYRAGVVQVLKREPGFQVIGEGNSADDAVRVVATLRPDVVILDVNMPGGGFDAARTIANNMPLTRIMMLTVLEDDSFVTAALQAGVKSYATKGVSGPVLVRTIWTMVHGPDFISPSLAASLLSENSPGSARLSDQDTEIFKLLAAGCTNEEVAGLLSLELRIVRHAISNILLQMTDSADRGTIPAARNKRRLH